MLPLRARCASHRAWPAPCTCACACVAAAPQAQRDFFGSHTYQRTDKEGWFHTVWDPNFGSADSITTSGYVA